jgi:hypothetical protein
VSTLKVNNLEDLGADPVAVNGVLVKAAFPAGTILQVVQVVKTDTFSTASTSYTGITGLTVTITPTSASSKILVLAQPTTSFVNQEAFIRISGGNSTDYVGDAAGSRTRVSASPHIAGGGRANAQTLVYLDSPATTSAVTYSVQAQVVSGGTFYLNRGTTDADNSSNVRGASTITLMEVAG